jgi:hypothetical protein
MRIINYLKIISMVVILFGCGGGGSSSPVASGPTTYSGQFIDAPTKGLLYSASPSGLTGTTDASGTFKFQAGDVVSFEIPTSGGSIPIGVHSPATPSSSTETSILHVSTMDNGTQVAQTLQSLGGTGSVIDVSNVKLTADEKTQFATYISSGATSQLPAKLTVSQADALFNAMASLGNLPSKINVSSLASLLSGSVVVHTGVLTAIIDNGTKPEPSVKLLNNSVSYLKSDNTVWNVCINSPWIDTTFPSDGGNNCGKTVIEQEGKWAVPSGSTNSVTTTKLSSPNFLNTVTFKDINSKQGLFTNSQPNQDDKVKSFTGYGQYIFMSNTWNKSFLAGTTYYANGFNQCTDGIFKSEYSKDATTVNVSCKISRVDGAANTPTPGGTLSDVKEIPGLAKMTLPDGSISYIGVAVGSTEKSGRSIMIKVGDNLCGTAGTEGGKKRSLDHCGSINIVTYFK